MTTSRRPTPRYLAPLPDDVHATFTAIRARRCHQGSQLFWCWLRDAVALARAGQTALTTPYLPAADAVMAGSKEAKWSQDHDEHAEWSQTLRLAGTSVEAVIQARVQEYNACDGDVTRMGVVSDDPPPQQPPRRLAS